MSGSEGFDSETSLLDSPYSESAVLEPIDPARPGNPATIHYGTFSIVITTRLSLLQNSGRNVAESWKEFHDLYRPFIHERVRVLIGGVQNSDAEDIAQNVMLVLHSRLPGFQYPRPGCFRAFLREVTRRQTMRWLTDRRRIRNPAGNVAILSRADSKMFEDLVDSDSVLSRTWDQQHLQFWRDRILMEAERRCSTSDKLKKSFELYRRVRIEGMEFDRSINDVGMSRSSGYRALMRIDLLVQEIHKEFAPMIDPES